MQNETISGTASAPGGSVAAFNQKTLLRLVVDSLISPATAAITGLEPVQGATVELIRVDNDGNQVGDVLATTATSLTGDYQLTLPTGVNLAGDLVVRITSAGSNGELRAQVVAEQVDISPVSEFVLQKFIANETDLKVLEPGAVVELSGQVEEFDLTADAGSNIAQMLEQLEAQTGQFVESQIESMELMPVSAAEVSGAYRSSIMLFRMEDQDQNLWGDFGIESWTSEFMFEGNEDGSVNVNWLGEEYAHSSMSGSDPNNIYIYYEVGIDQDTDTFPATLNEQNVMTIEAGFEEDIDGDWGDRQPPTTYRLQKVKDQNLFVLLSQEAEVAYETLDLDQDGVKDAIDPDARIGDTVFRGLEIFYEKAEGMSTADLSGEFGRVYTYTEFDQSGYLETETEYNTVTFSGTGTLDVSAAMARRLSRTSQGAVGRTSEQVEGETGLTISIEADGDIATIGGEPADGFVNATQDLVVFTESSGTNEQDASFGTTYLVKLPQSTPAVSGKRYRLMSMDLFLEETAMELSYSRFNSFVTLSSETEGTISIDSGSMRKDSLQSQIEVNAYGKAEFPVTTSVAANGEMTIVADDGEGEFTMNGYLNETASYGVFTINYRKASDNEAEAIGVAFLVEVDAQ